MRIILYGPPGSGKGTQGDLVLRKFGYPKISTGDLLRRAVQDKTALGLKADAAMRKGLLVSDTVVLELLKERISLPDCRTAYVLDGFPRNIKQARAIGHLEAGRPEVFIEIRVDEETLVGRLSARRICSKCGAIHNLATCERGRPESCDICRGDLEQRPDDLPEVIKERFRVYNRETEKVREFYRSRNAYHAVDGRPPAMKVFETVSAIIERELAGSKEARVIR